MLPESLTVEAAESNHAPDRSHIQLALIPSDAKRVVQPGHDLQSASALLGDHVDAVVSVGKWLPRMERPSILKTPVTDT